MSINRALIQTVYTFLASRVKEPKSLLVGFSGGPDSLALLHLLVEVQRRLPIKISLAHVDHGWRPESAHEASEIARMADRLGIKLHLKSLDPLTLVGNLEAACRDERLRFFSALSRDFGYDAVLLGHHADDQAETVLKRICEGASLTTLGGIPEESVIGAMKIWRPLLKITKKQILQMLKGADLIGFHDKTNDDLRYLRARLRKVGFPELEDVFGKEVSKNLCLLAEESRDIRNHLDSVAKPLLERIIVGPWGYFLDLNDARLFPPYQLKFVVRRFAELGLMSLSRESVALSAGFVTSGIANKWVNSGGVDSEKILVIDRGRLFLLNNPLHALSCSQRVEIRPGETIDFSGWRITMCPYYGEEIASGWQHLWRGKVELVVKREPYQIASPNADFLQKKSRVAFDKLWTSHKIPSFLRSLAPVVVSNSGDSIEFLSVKTQKFNEDVEWFKLVCCLI